MSTSYDVYVKSTSVVKNNQLSYRPECASHQMEIAEQVYLGMVDRALYKTEGNLVLTTGLKT